MFADASMWLAAANIIATMDLTFAKDHFGRDIIPEPTFISGFVRCVTSSHSLVNSYRTLILVLSLAILRSLHAPSTRVQTEYAVSSHI